jgi:hyperosmotically inducible protein
MRIAKSVLALIAMSSFSLTGVYAADKGPASHLDPYINGPANESKLIKDVRHQLLMLPYYGVFDDLGFNVNGSTVTLTGEVTRPTLKDDAASAAKKVEGVTNVVNNIEVLPLSNTDDSIRMAAYRAIYGDANLAPRYAYNATQQIHIIVKNGNLRLEGVAANAMDKQIAGMKARGLPGVFNVENDLQVGGK